MKNTTPIDGTAEYLDSREIEERIEYLESIETQTVDEAEELSGLIQFRRDVDSREWPYGLQLIRDDYFAQYIEELIDECYELPKNMEDWPYRHMTMDYESAVDEARADYSEVQLWGVSYLYRD